MPAISQFLNFCEENFHDRKSNHEIQENSVQWKFGGVRQLALPMATNAKIHLDTQQNRLVTTLVSNGCGDCQRESWPYLPQQRRFQGWWEGSGGVAMSVTQTPIRRETTFASTPTRKKNKERDRPGAFLPQQKRAESDTSHLRWHILEGWCYRLLDCHRWQSWKRSDQCCQESLGCTAAARWTDFTRNKKRQWLTRERKVRHGRGEDEDDALQKVRMH